MVHRWLLFRRSLRTSDEITDYFAYARRGGSHDELAGAAGLRWRIEECFLRAKDDLGRDHCEARSWHAWHRHMTLVMAAAFSQAPSIDAALHGAPPNLHSAIATSGTKRVRAARRPDRSATKPSYHAGNCRMRDLRIVDEDLGAAVAEEITSRWRWLKRNTPMALPSVPSAS